MAITGMWEESLRGEFGNGLVRSGKDKLETNIRLVGLDLFLFMSPLQDLSIETIRINPPTCRNGHRQGDRGAEGVRQHLAGVS